MMKKLSSILLLLNLIFFAVMHWGLLPDDHAIQALPELHRDKIRQISAMQDRSDSALSTTDATVFTLNHLQVGGASSPMTGYGSEGQTGRTVCMEWGDFSGASLEQATTALSSLQLGDKASRRQVENTIGYWVYIPPMKDKATVNRRISRLRYLGVDEYFVVMEPGPWLNAISLGIFKTRDAAQHFLDELQRTKDVHDARVGERVSKHNMTRLFLQGLDASASASLAEIQKDFAESELKEVPCALTRQDEIRKIPNSSR